MCSTAATPAACGCFLLLWCFFSSESWDDSLLPLDDADEPDDEEELETQF
jgi:hypothetical protein